MAATATAGDRGYDREWRSDPAVSGGGELLDQGAHLVDLLLWILDTDFDSVSAETVTAFWEMPVEDNAFALLRTAGGQVASLHVSWTQWRNLFSLEVFGRDGYAVAEGLGGSYGEERLVLGRRPPDGRGPRRAYPTVPGARPVLGPRVEGLRGRRRGAPVSRSRRGGGAAYDGPPEQDLRRSPGRAPVRGPKFKENRE